MDLSIVIVNYNTKELTRNCIHSVIRNTWDISYEIILIDNASKDKSCEYLRGFFPNIKIVANNTNCGYAKANNQGIRIAQARYILLLNSDTIVVDDCLKKVLDYAAGRCDVGIVGCKVLNKDGSLQYSCYHNPFFLSELIFFTKSILKGFWDPITHYKYMHNWDHCTIKEVDCVSGCFMFIKRDVFDVVGHLDENYFMYYEDSDFCRCVKAVNYKVSYYPYAQIIHFHGSSGDSASYSTLKQCFVSACYYFSKFYGTFLSKAFRLLCASIFRIEAWLLIFFRNSKKCAEKKRMLKALLD